MGRKDRRRGGPRRRRRKGGITAVLRDGCQPRAAVLKLLNNTRPSQPVFQEPLLFFFSLKKESIKALHFPKFSWVSKCFLNHQFLEGSIPLIGRGCFPERAPRGSPPAWGGNFSLLCLFPSLHHPSLLPCSPHPCILTHANPSMSETHLARIVVSYHRNTALCTCLSVYCTSSLN